MKISTADIRPGMRIQWGHDVLTVRSIVWIRNGGGLMTFHNGHVTSVNKVGTATVVTD